MQTPPPPPGGRVPSNKTSIATRLTNLVFFLEEHGRGATAFQIRNEVAGYDPRQSDDAFDKQFYRDREKLAGMGFRIDRLEGEPPLYVLDLESIMQNRIELAFADFTLLRISAQMAMDNPNFAWKKALLSALHKLRPQLEADVAGSETGDPQADGVGAGAHLSAQISDAIDSAQLGRSLLVFGYRNAKGETSTRRVCPLKVFRYLGDMYLMGYDAERRGVRRFRFDRFLEAPSLEAADAQTIDAVREHRDDEAVLLPFQIGSQSLEGKLYFSKQALNKAEKLLRPESEAASPTSEPHGEGIVVNVRVASPRRLAQWVVENGPGILPIEPAETLQILKRGLGEVRDDG